MEFAGDPEAVARDEDTVEDDRGAAGVMRDALGLERRLAGAAPEVARLAATEAHRRDGLVRAHDDDAELELEDLVQRRPREIGPHHLVAGQGRRTAPPGTASRRARPWPRDPRRSGAAGGCRSRSRAQRRTSRDRGGA